MSTPGNKPLGKGPGFADIHDPALAATRDVPMRRWFFGNVVVEAADRVTAHRIYRLARIRHDASGSETLPDGAQGSWIRLDSGLPGG